MKATVLHYVIVHAGPLGVASCSRSCDNKLSEDVGFVMSKAQTLENFPQQKSLKKHAQDFSFKASFQKPWKTVKSLVQQAWFLVQFLIPQRTTVKHCCKGWLMLFHHPWLKALPKGHSTQEIHHYLLRILPEIHVYAIEFPCLAVWKAPSELSHGNLSQSKQPPQRRKRFTSCLSFLKSFSS